MRTLVKPKSPKPPKAPKLKPLAKPKLEVGLGTKSRAPGGGGPRFFSPPKPVGPPKLNINPATAPADDESAELEAPPRPDEAEGPKDAAALAHLLGGLGEGGVPSGPPRLGGAAITSRPVEPPIPARRGDVAGGSPIHGPQTHINIHLPPIQAKEARPMMRRARKRI